MRLADVLVGLDRPVSYYPALRPICGSVNAVIFLQQFLYWTGKQADPDGWIYKTRDAIEQETGLTRYEQEHARKLLRERGFIEEVRRGIPATMYYRVILPAINAAWDQHTSQGDSSPPVGGKTPDLTAAGPPTISENTSETTQESTTDSGTSSRQATAGEFRFAGRMKPLVVIETYAEPPPPSPAAPPTPYATWAALCEQVGWDPRLNTALGIKKIKELAASGVLLDEIVACVHWLQDDPYWRDKGVDIKLVQSQMQRFRSRKTTTVRTLQDEYEETVRELRGWTGND